MAAGGTMVILPFALLAWIVAVEGLTSTTTLTTRTSILKILSPIPTPPVPQKPLPREIELEKKDPPEIFSLCVEGESHCADHGRPASLIDLLKSQA